jgi:hypothetical protein
MSDLPAIAHAIVHHREHTEHRLARVRHDTSLDDHEKGYHITTSITETHSGLVALSGRSPSAWQRFPLAAPEIIDVTQRRRTTRRAAASVRGL